MNLKCFHYVVTAKSFMSGDWYRHTDLSECLKQLGKPKQYTIYTGVCKEDTPAEVIQALLPCWNVTWQGSLAFYEQGDTEQEQKEYEKDRALVKEWFIGWITTNVDLQPKPKTSKKA